MLFYIISIYFSSLYSIKKRKKYQRKIILHFHFINSSPFSSSLFINFPHGFTRPCLSLPLLSLISRLSSAIPFIFCLSSLILFLISVYLLPSAILISSTICYIFPFSSLHLRSKLTFSPIFFSFQLVIFLFTYIFFLAIPSSFTILTNFSFFHFLYHPSNYFIFNLSNI